MIFQDIPQGAAVFIDANILIYYFGPDPVLGPPCAELMNRIDRKDVQGFVSVQVVMDVAHRLMALEACAVFGWPHQGIARRLRQHPSLVMQLTRYHQAIDEFALTGIRTLDTSGPQISRAADVSRQTGLLTSDALIVAVMRDHQLTHLASNDSDFDRVPGLLRYAPL
jgi:uncharacterized protein